MTMPLPQDIIPQVVPPLLGFIPSPQDIPGVAQITQLGDALGAVRRWISDRHNWVRVAWTLGGVVLMVSGVAVMAGKPAAQAVTATAKVIRP